MSTDLDPNALRFSDDTGLIPTIVQDDEDGTVLMLGYMNREALDRTRTSGRVTFYSRSRGRIWEKGETSGNVLHLASLSADCDADALLVRATPDGPTCHTGARSCFGPAGDSGTPHTRLGKVLAGLWEVIEGRAASKPAGSYTVKLLEDGPLRPAQKVAEEAAETALASVAEPERLASESADLLYHLLVLWRAVGIDPADVAEELAGRAT